MFVDKLVIKKYLHISKMGVNIKYHKQTINLEIYITQIFDLSGIKKHSRNVCKAHIRQCGGCVVG